jgi:uncharacterized protein YgbK (DUF1537 family)
MVAVTSGLVKAIYKESDTKSIPLEECTKQQTEEYINKLMTALYNAQMAHHEHAIYTIRECLDMAHERLELFESGAIKEARKPTAIEILEDD